LLKAAQVAEKRSLLANNLTYRAFLASQAAERPLKSQESTVRREFTANGGPSSAAFPGTTKSSSTKKSSSAALTSELSWSCGARPKFMSISVT
jgi:hypothetical protein